jgi:AAA domain-containing protein
VSATPPRTGADNGSSYAHKPKPFRGVNTAASRTSDADDDWSDDPQPMPEAVQLKFDALPQSVREMFRIKGRRIDNALEYCELRVRALRHQGFEVHEMVAVARAYPAQFGILGTQTWPTFAKMIGELNKVEAEAAAANRKSGRLRILSIDELLALPPRDYLVKGWISPNETSLLVGAKNARKTFSALHVGYGIAQGWKTIFGRRVHQAPVLYLIAEGERGIGKRVTALVKRHGRCTEFHVIAQQIDLLRSTADAGDLHDIIALAKANGVRLIIVDTISRALAGGDENGPTDMGILSVNLNVLRQETGAHVMGIHHGTQEQGTKSRGHSTLPFGVDAIAQLEWNANDGIGRLALGFARDDVSGALGAFRTEPVTLGMDADNDPITTLQVMECQPDEVPAAVTQKGRSKTDLGDKLTKFLTTARNVIAGSGEMVVPAAMMPKVRAVPRAVIRSEWIAAGCFPETDVESSDPDRKANNEWRLTRHGYSTENNALRGLERRGVLMFNQHWAWQP